MAAVVALLHSPMLGPLSWRPTADQLTTQQRLVAVPDLRAALTKAPYVRSYVSAAAQAVDHAGAASAVLLGHSASGPLLPAIAQAAATPISGLIYVDAALPYPDRSWFDTAPPQLSAHLRGLARHGQLPPWNQWFPARAIDELIPDPDVRHHFVEQLPSVPLPYFHEALPPADWSGPCGYLQLSAVYSEHADRAEAAGWPVRRLNLDHLAMMTSPAAVAVELTGQLATFEGPSICSTPPPGRSRAE